MPSSADRFGILFSRAFANFKALWKPLLTGAVLFAILLAVVQALLPDEQVVETITVQQGIGMFAFFIASLIVSYAGYLYLMAITVEGQPTLEAGFARIPSLFLPIIGVSIWAFLRSFMWVALIGMILIGIAGGLVNLPEVTSFTLLAVGVVLTIGGFVLGILWGPRFMLAPIILLREKKMTIRDATEQSFVRSRGYWWKIVGNTVLVSLILMVVMMVVGIVFGILATASAFALQAITAPVRLFAMIAGAAIMGTISLLTQSFTLLFTVQLTDTITKHPRK